MVDNYLLRTRWLGAVIALIACLYGSGRAQDPDKPLALLRQLPGTAEFSLRVQTNATLPANSKLTAILTNKSDIVAWSEAVKDCPTAQAGEFCKQFEDGLVIINYKLPAKPQPSDKIKVSYAISDPSGRGSFRSIDLSTDFKSGGPRTDALCKNGLLVDFQADNASNDPNDASYYESRLLALRRWLRANKANPSEMASVRFERLTEKARPDPRVINFTVEPALDDKQPQELDIESALGAKRAKVCLQLDQPLPDGKFNARVMLRNDQPVEFEKPLTKALTGPKAAAVPVASKVPDDNKLGLRAFDNNLEVGVLFTSSVKDVKVGSKTNRQRQSRGSLDLRFAPLLRDRVNPPKAKSWQIFRTPLFLDAKISTGKISDDTLSLNRVLIGTEVNFRYVEGTSKGHRNKYIITLRGTNAADRDFKRAEAKAEFEFRPVFERLNQPLKIRHTSTKSELIPDGPRIELASGWFGYQIQPFIGVEAGSLYRHSRGAFKAEEQSKSIRRLLFGTDVSFNFTQRLTLTMSEIFYWRGETPEHRGRNYFIGTLEAPLGNFSRNAAQSIFFSLERGNQPPFASPAVNALKFGYRVRSDFFDTGAAR